jgi:hypothetical protein
MSDSQSYDVSEMLIVKEMIDIANTPPSTYIGKLLVFLI